jgi:hypothetical protein
VVFFFFFFFFFFFYSCCSHLEHRASVKPFVSLQFLNLKQSLRFLGWDISPPQARYRTQTQNKYKQTAMPSMGLQPAIPLFGREKTFHALNRTATVIGQIHSKYTYPPLSSCRSKFGILFRSALSSFVLPFNCNWVRGCFDRCVKLTQAGAEVKNAETYSSFSPFLIQSMMLD